MYVYIFSETSVAPMPAPVEIRVAPTAAAPAPAPAPVPVPAPLPGTVLQPAPAGAPSPTPLVDPLPGRSLRVPAHTLPARRVPGGADPRTAALISQAISFVDEESRLLEHIHVIHDSAARARQGAA